MLTTAGKMVNSTTIIRIAAQEHYKKARSFQELGEKEAAEAEYNKALNKLQEAFNLKQDRLETIFQKAKVLCRHAELLEIKEDFNEAEKKYQQAIKCLEDIPEGNGSDNDRSIQNKILAEIYCNYGDCLEKKENIQSAKNAYEKAIKNLEIIKYYEELSNVFAEIYFRQGDFLNRCDDKDANIPYEKAIYYAKRSNKDKLATMLLLKRTYEGHANFFKKFEKIPEANASFKEALDYERKIAVYKKSTIDWFSSSHVKSLLKKHQAPHLSEEHKEERRELDQYLVTLPTSTEPCFTKALQSPSWNDYPLIKGFNEVQDTRHLVWCLKQNNLVNLPQVLQEELLEQTRQIIEKFQTSNGSQLALIQEIVVLGEVDHIGLYRDIIKALVEKRENNIGALKGLSALFFKRMDSSQEEYAIEERVDLLKYLLERLKNTAQVNGSFLQAETLLRTLSFLLDQITYFKVTGIHPETIRDLSEVLTQFEAKAEQGKTLKWPIQYIRQALAMQQTFEYLSSTSSTDRIIRGRVLPALGGVSHLLSFSLQIVAGGGVTAGTGIEKLWNAYECFEQALRFAPITENPKPWYQKLCFITYLLNVQGRPDFLEGPEGFLEKCKDKHTGQHEDEFLFGLCERLAWMACLEADQSTRDGALRLLKKLEQHGTLETVQLSGSAAVKRYAHSTLDHVALQWKTPNIMAMERRGMAPEVWHPFWQGKPNTQLLATVREAAQFEPKLKTIVKHQYQEIQNKLHPLVVLGRNIEQFRTQFRANLEKIGELDALETLYIPLQGRERDQDDAPVFSLEAYFNEVLRSEAKVILLQGIAGSGKSTFNRYLALKKLSEYTHETDPQKMPELVFFIELRRIKNPHQNAIQEFLKKEKFTDSEIDLLREHPKCIFIFDGYDEIKDHNKNFYDLNELWQWENAKFVITSRPEYLDPGYQRYFCGPNLSPTEQKEFLREVWVAPFSERAQRDYIESYVTHKSTEWTIEQYQQALANIPALKEEFKRPVVLQLILTILPELKKNGVATEHLTVGAIYETYLQKWWERWQDRLVSIQLTADQEAAKNLLAAARPGGFVEQGFKYSQNCAIALTKAGLVMAENDEVFKDKYEDVYLAFFDESAHTQLLLLNAPLSRTASGYQFPHKSLQEYWVARAVFKSGSVKSSGAFEYHSPRHDRTLNQVNLILEPNILNFLAQHVIENPAFESHLRAWIHASKKDEQVSQGAANAATILVRSGVQFHDEDFQGIRIPGANLAQGIWDGVNFSDADLSHVRFDSAWLRNTKFDRARLTGVEFGELPALAFDRPVIECCYSPDGYWIAVALGNVVELYEAKTLARKSVLRGHVENVQYIEFSPNGEHLIAGSHKSGRHIHLPGRHGNIEVENDCDTITIWATGLNGFTLLTTFTANLGKVRSVAFSPNGDQLATGSKDGSIRLWGITEGDAAPNLVKTFQKQTSEINSVSFSSDGALLASGSKDRSKNLKIWSVTGENTAPLTGVKGHKGEVASVAFSSSGNDILLASGGEYMDETVKLWSFENNHLRPLKTFDGGFNRVRFSAKNDWIVSGGKDNAVTLWPVKGESLASVWKFHGHQARIESVGFSHDGTQVLSSNHDRTVKLWSIAGLETAARRQGHTSGVGHIALLPNGQFVSGSEEGVIKLWSIVDSKPTFLKDFKVHDWIHALASSPNSGSLVATRIKGNGLNDFTAKIWSVTGENVTPITTLPHTGWIHSMAFSHRGKYLAVSAYGVKLLSIEGSNVTQLKNFEHAQAMSLTFSPDNTLLASGGGLGSSFDGPDDSYAIKLWEVEGSSTTPVKIFRGHTGEVYSLAFSPDQSLIASGSRDTNVVNPTIKIWSVAGHADALKTLTGHTSTVVSVAFSANGKLLASGSLDGTARIWSVDSGECLVTIQGPAVSVSSVIWHETPEGQYLLTGGGDHVVRLWQILRGQTYRAALCWASQQDRLTLNGASIEGATGLTPLDRELLQQKGGVGEPASSHSSSITQSTAPAYA